MTTIANPFGASDAAVGYLFQCRYALLLLLQRYRVDSAAALSIERFDDITFEKDGSPTELIQTKHSLGASRTLSDASTDLWKTIRVWSEGLAARTFSVPGTTFALVTTSTAPEGSAASLLRETGRDEQKAIQQLSVIAAAAPNKELGAAYAAFLALGDVRRGELFRAIQVLDNAPDIRDVLPQIMTEVMYTTRRENLQALVEGIEGWWYGVVVEHLSSETPRTITGSELEQKIFQIQETLRRDSLPTTFCFASPQIGVDPAGDSRIFVKQLRVINCGEDTISTAICDHYKSSAQRAQWIRQELLLIDELSHYDQHLVDEWQRKFTFEKEDLGTEPTPEAEIKSGMRLYRWAHDQNMYIRSECREPIIPRGTYHILADELQVGWHPRYDALLREDTKK